MVAWSCSITVKHSKSCLLVSLWLLALCLSYCVWLSTTIMPSLKVFFFCWCCTGWVGNGSEKMVKTSVIQTTVDKFGLDTQGRRRQSLPLYRTYAMRWQTLALLQLKHPGHSSVQSFALVHVEKSLDAVATRVLGFSLSLLPYLPVHFPRQTHRQAS